jgi:hypothetical protein
MPDDRIVEFSAVLTGEVRGRGVNGPAIVRLGERGLALAMERAELRLPYGRLDGWAVDDVALVVYVAGGDVLRMEPAGGAAPLANALAVHACVLPELTRGLRALGSSRSRADSAQATLFAPLLAGRRRAARMRDPAGRLQALDARLIARELQNALAEIAAARVSHPGPERRALDAALEEAAAPLRAAVQALARAAEAYERAPDPRRLASWREWTESARAAFATADACWPAVRAALADAHSPSGRWRRWTRLGIAVLALWMPSHVAAQHQQLRVEGAEPRALQAEGFDVVSAGRGFAIVVADSGDRARLASRGLLATELETPVAIAIHSRPLFQTGAVTSVYRSFDDSVRGIAAWLDSVAVANPLVHLDTLGTSWEGRPVLAAKIGAPDDAAGRPNVVFLATYHAREWAATEMALRLLAYLASASSDARVDSLVARRDIWIVPVVNPDGYQYSHTTDRFWRKNRRVNADGSIGVDLNRNHDYRWALDDFGSSPVPSSQTYRGTAPHSEPETQAIAALHAAHPPVLGVSYHTFTGLILHPWGYAFGRVPDDWSIFRALAGTDVDPAVIDRLPGSNRDHYHPAPSWNLYTTNGDYTDWAYGARGVLAFTPELTSGWEGPVFYGFDFPDDEAKLQRLFLDNLPFALDVLDAAADPLHAQPMASGLRVHPVELESLSPMIRLRVPLGALATARVREPAGMPLAPDTATGRAVFTRRMVSPRLARAARVVVEAAGERIAYEVLAATGAEPDDVPWSTAGWKPEAGAVAGDSAWAAYTGTLRSPPIDVPAGADTVSVLFWTRYFGDAFSFEPRGEIRVSDDDGATWRTVGIVAGVAPVYYPERADIAGVAGRTIRVEFAARFFGTLPAWWLDEITVVRRSEAPPLAASSPVSVRPSENPVRGSQVRFAWPFAAEGGTAAAYDGAGREVWRASVAPQSSTVVWSLDEHPVANGAYFVVLRSGRREARGRLFVLRSGE